MFSSTVDKQRNIPQHKLDCCLHESFRQVAHLSRWANGQRHSNLVAKSAFRNWLYVEVQANSKAAVGSTYQIARLVYADWFGKPAAVSTVCSNFAW